MVTLFFLKADMGYLQIMNSLFDHMHSTLNDKRQIPLTSVLSQVSYIFKRLLKP